MKGKKRVREELTALPNLEYWNEKVKTGWRLVAVEWERESEEPGTSVETWEEVPYGLKVAEDCTHLVENPAEREAMTLGRATEANLPGRTVTKAHETQAWSTAFRLHGVRAG